MGPAKTPGVYPAHPVHGQQPPPPPPPASPSASASSSLAFLSTPARSYRRFQSRLRLPVSRRCHSATTQHANWSLWTCRSAAPKAAECQRRPQINTTPARPQTTAWSPDFKRRWLRGEGWYFQEDGRVGWGRVGWEGGLGMRRDEESGERVGKRAGNEWR